MEKTPEKSATHTNEHRHTYRQIIAQPTIENIVLVVMTVCVVGAVDARYKLIF